MSRRSADKSGRSCQVSPEEFPRALPAAGSGRCREQASTARHYCPVATPPPSGSPACSPMASRLSCAGYFAAAGPSANAVSTFAVTRRVKRPAALVRPQPYVRRPEGLHPAHGPGVEDARSAGVGVVGRVGVAADALADQRRVREHLDRPLDRIARGHPVVLDAHQDREPRALTGAGAPEHPGVRRPDHVVGNRRVALVERADQRGLGVRVRRLAPVARDQPLCLPYIGSSS